MIGRMFLGRYQAVRLIGEGGMGRVFLARDTNLGRQVVVKVMHDHIAADQKFLERFLRETTLTARFQHPYAVAVYDAATDANGPCLIMEYIKGVNLDALLAKTGRFTPQRVGRLLGQLCEVLQAAHDDGIVHRDLKPANLMVIDPDTPREKIKVMDFGLAKCVNDNQQLKKVTDTNVDFAVGTPGYIAPEQVRGEEMDHRGDIYAVGVLLYELLTGRLPFTGPTSMDMLLAHATEPPPTFAEIGVENWAPASVEELVMACLAKDPSDRPQNARDLAELYEQALTREAEAAAGPAHWDNPVGTVEEPAAPAGLPPITDPNTAVYQMEAWMPESIALVKLRGFVHDYGGEILESVPGLIRVRLASRGSSGSFSWLGLGRRNRPLQMELRLFQPDEDRANHLQISVIFRAHDAATANDQHWRDRCTHAFIEVRGYLMGQ